MASASLTLFCLPDELAAYVRRMAEKFQYGTLLFRLDADALVVVDPATLKTVPPGTERVFLHPRKPVRKVITMDDASPRQWGWIDITAGALTGASRSGLGKKVLTLTRIDGETSPKASVQPTQAINWLKRQIKNEVTFGVVGRSDVARGGTRYHDIGYTKGAHQLQRAGCVWKSELTHRSFFEPARKRR